MNNSNTRGLGILAAVLAAVLALAFFGLRPQRVETEPATEYSYDPATDGELGPLVVRTVATGGISIFGLQFGRREHTVSVQFLAPSGCSRRLSVGQSWPPADPACSTPFTVAGTVSGLGTTADGRSVIGLDIDVSEDCAATIELGTPWPPTSGACAVSAPG